jgi:toxin FitB
MFLIDTVTLSELRRRERDAMMVKWFEQQRVADLFLSVISVGEMERGIARQRAADPAFAEAPAVWLDRVLTVYGERVVPFDLRAARRWGTLSAALGNDSADLMIAATALEHGLTVVTRNVSYFEPAGVVPPRPPGDEKDQLAASSRSSVSSRIAASASIGSPNAKPWAYSQPS